MQCYHKHILFFVVHCIIQNKIFQNTSDKLYSNSTQPQKACISLPFIMFRLKELSHWTYQTKSKTGLGPPPRQTHLSNGPPQPPPSGRHTCNYPSNPPYGNLHTFHVLGKNLLIFLYFYLLKKQKANGPHRSLEQK